MEGTPIMIIDIHAHTCKPRHPKIRRMNGKIYPPPERFIEMLDETGTDKACLLCDLGPECLATIVTPEECMEIWSMYPDRLMMLGLADTAEPGTQHRE